MNDLIYHRGVPVAYIKLGSVYTKDGDKKVGSISSGKIFSNEGKMIGSFRNVTDPSPDRSLSNEFCAVLDIKE